MKRFFTLFLTALLLLSSTAFAAGPLYIWTIREMKGNTLTITNQYGHSDLVEGEASDIAGLMKYFGVKKASELRGRRFSGDDLARSIITYAAWAENMTVEDKMIEALSKGILTKKAFDLPKGSSLSSVSDFVANRYLRKDIIQKLGERIEILSNGKCELIDADREDFRKLPKAVCYDTLALRETLMILESSQGAGISTTQRSQSTRIHLFSLSADCLNAVQFDKTTEVVHLKDGQSITPTAGEK